MRESTDFLSGSVGCWKEKERERERESDETNYSKFSLRETFFDWATKKHIYVLNLIDENRSVSKMLPQCKVLLLLYESYKVLTTHKQKPNLLLLGPFHFALHGSTYLIFTLFISLIITLFFLPHQLWTNALDKFFLGP